MLDHGDEPVIEEFHVNDPGAQQLSAPSRMHHSHIAVDGDDGT